MAFTVDRDPKRASKPGDRIRQGRVSGRAGDVRRDGAGRVAVQYDLRSDGCHYVRIGRADVGVICAQDTGLRPGFNWLCFLPEQRRSPQFAETLDKAKDAIRVVIEEWCLVAGLAPRPKGRAPIEGWRA